MAKKTKLTGSQSTSTLEIRVDPRRFSGEWIEHVPTSQQQRDALYLFKELRSKDQLHPFACMGVDPAIKGGKLVYKYGLQPAVGIPYEDWTVLLQNYNPRRNSRIMPVTEFIFRNMSIIPRLIELGYDIDRAWQAVFDNSEGIGVFQEDFFVRPKETGTRGVAQYMDLSNTGKLLANDGNIKKRADTPLFWIGGCTTKKAIHQSVSDLISVSDNYCLRNANAYPGAVGMLMMDC